MRKKEQEIVWATHNETGVLFPVRKETFEIQTYLWTRAEAPKPTPVPVEVPASVEETEEPDVIQTASGAPFKTEQAAKSAMKKKGLSEDAWMTMEVPEGFIITRK